MTRYIKNLEDNMASILRESLVDDAAELVGIDRGDVEERIKGLSFANYLELGNAVDIDDAETAQEILSTVAPIEPGVEEDAGAGGTGAGAVAAGPGIGGGAAGIGSEAAGVGRPTHIKKSKSVGRGVYEDDIEEADNPYQTVTPPSQQMPSNTMAGKGQITPGRKDVNNLSVGDNIEVIDMDDQPQAVKVKNPRSPGDTLVVQNKKGEEFIVKKGAVTGTPKMESVGNKNLRIGQDNDGKWYVYRLPSKMKMSKGFGTEDEALQKKRSMELSEALEEDPAREKVYPNSSRGAKDMLSDLSTWDTSEAKAIPDPEVEGVWLVRNIFDKHDSSQKGQAIVYLAGYRDPWGQVRKDNDFEDEEFFEEISMENLRSMYETELQEKGRTTRIKNKTKLGDKIKRAERFEKKKKLDHVDEAKAGNFNSKMIGRRVKIVSQEDAFGNNHFGEEGVVIRASREHTFSQMVPFIVEYGVELDSGKKITIRRESVRKVKEQPVAEEFHNNIVDEAELGRPEKLSREHQQKIKDAVVPVVANYVGQKPIRSGERGKYVGGDSRANWPPVGEARNASNTEHSGAKKGKGAYYGRKKDAKSDSNKKRREDDKKAVDEARNANKTEHSGAKKGKGAYYGQKKTAKSDSNKKRREDDKKAVDEDIARIRKLAGIQETASCGSTGAGAIATAPASVGGSSLISRMSNSQSIYDKTTQKPKRKKRKQAKEDTDVGIGRSRKE